jgi:excinuclease ABC subunit A
MAMDFIRIRGARTHNLKNIDLDLPRDKLIVITGLSGSGKSSLAFDTIYAEGQRRYVESLSAYARQFLSVMEKPDVDHIEGLSPAISIEQKSTSHNPRSTVGTITEIYDYLRLLYARVGTPRCPDHGYPLEAQTVSQMVDQVLALDPNSAGCCWPGRARAQGRACAGVRPAARAGLRARARGRRAARDRRGAAAGTAPEAHHRSGDRPLPPARRHQAAPGRSFETALRLGDGMAAVRRGQDGCRAAAVSSKYSCPVCDYALPELEPRLFSFNSPVGACPAATAWA